MYPERQKRQTTRFVCNFNGKSVFRCTQRVITQRRVITLGPIFIKMVLNRAQGLKKKSQEVSTRKNNNRQRYNKKCWRGGRILPPPRSFRAKCLNGMTPEYLSSSLSRHRPACAGLRSALDSTRMFVHNTTKTLMSPEKSCFLYTAPPVWNNLPVNIRNSQSFMSLENS